MKRYTPPEYTAKSTNHWYSRKKRRTAGHTAQTGLPAQGVPPTLHTHVSPTHQPCRVWAKGGELGTHWTVTEGIHGCEGAGLQLERGISGDTESLLFTIAIGPAVGWGRGAGGQGSILHFPLPSPAHLSLPQPGRFRAPPSEHRSWPGRCLLPQFGCPLNTKLQAPPAHRAGPQQTSKHSAPTEGSPVMTVKAIRPCVSPILPCAQVVPEGGQGRPCALQPPRRLGAHSPVLPASGPLLPCQGPKLFLGRVLVSEETAGKDRQAVRKAWAWRGGAVTSRQ